MQYLYSSLVIKQNFSVKDMETNTTKHKLEMGQLVIASKTDKSSIWNDIGVVDRKRKRRYRKKNPLFHARNVINVLSTNLITLVQPIYIGMLHNVKISLQHLQNN